MPQSLVVANGNLLASFNAHLQMTDFFYPHIGQENHSLYGNPHRIGVWTEQGFSWLGPDWDFQIGYHDSTLVGNSKATHKDLQIELGFEDFVYTTHDVLVRKIKVTNTASEKRKIKLYFGHDFYIHGQKMEDTAQYEPDLNAVLHYRKKRYFLVNGQWENGQGMHSFSVGKSNYGNREGTWKDAEDGHLHQNPIEQGSVDSVVEFETEIRGGTSQTLFFWVTAGTDYNDITRNNNRVLNLGPQKVMNHSQGYWKQWSQKHEIKLAGLPKTTQKFWEQSLLIMRSQIDNRGAIIASSDSDIMEFNKDTYSYMWPRDGALVSLTLSRVGYFEVSKRFLGFCKRIITNEGYIEHKFTADGSLGSSWHPKWKNGQKQLPIQEDESALVLVALWELYAQSKSIEVVQRQFNSVVLRIGRFLMKHIDPQTGLPLPSYDLWEEQFGIFSYTAATTYGGLKAAENLARITGHHEDEAIFKKAAHALQKSILKYLYDEENNRFVKKATLNADGSLALDPTVDSSLVFLWEMDVLPADDPRMISTIKAIEDHLTIRTETGGIARYEGDFYHRNLNHHYSADVPGNPWIITTLWLANWYIETATKPKDLNKAKAIIFWAQSKANHAQILPEQLDPFSNQPLSVAPLTWSHSTFIDTTLRFSHKYEELHPRKA